MKTITFVTKFLIVSVLLVIKLWGLFLLKLPKVTEMKEYFFQFYFHTLVFSAFFFILV